MTMEKLLTTLSDYERQSRQFDPDADTHKKWHDYLASFSHDYLQQLPTSPVTRKKPNLNIKHIFDINETASIEAILQLIDNYIIDHSMETASSRHMGYIPGGGIPLSAFADYLAAISNRYAGNIVAAPGAVEMERAMIRWMSKIVGYPETASGNLASGGSYASMIALVTAREAYKIKPNDIEHTVIYLTDLTHHSIRKCLKTIGLHHAIIRRVPLDESFRMDAVALEKLINQDKQDNLKPFLIVATVGTTDTGSVDPIKHIATTAKQHKLWLHLDAAYGGFFKLSPTVSTQLKHMGLADSITLDPHKGLFLPYGIGAVLVKDAESQKSAFAETANYMQDIITAEDEWSPSDMSPELTKHFRALRMWMPLKYYGVTPFKAALEEKLLLARYFYDQLYNFPNVDIACPPDLSIVVFRFHPTSQQADRFNKALLERIVADGRVFFSSTALNGHYYIRMACLSFRTHLDDINLALSIIQNSLRSIDIRI